MIRVSYLEWRAAGDDFGDLGTGRFRRRAPGKTGGLLRAGMVARARIRRRRLTGGRRSGIVGFSRYLANPRVTGAARLDGWGAEHTPRCEGRHILAIRDSSDLDFKTTKARSRGLGEIGKGSGRAVFCCTRCWVWVPGRAACIPGLARGPDLGAGSGGRIWGPDMGAGYGHAMAG